MYQPGETVIENNRVLPFGESWQAPAISTNNEKFTTYNRDTTNMHRRSVNSRAVLGESVRNPD